MDYTANDIRRLREETHRPMDVVKAALTEARTYEEATEIALTHPVVRCRCGIPHGEPHP